MRYKTHQLTRKIIHEDPSKAQIAKECAFHDLGLGQHHVSGLFYYLKNSSIRQVNIGLYEDLEMKLRI